MELSNVEIQSWYNQGRFEDLVEVLSARQDSISRIYYVRSLISLKRYEEAIHLIMNYRRIGNVEFVVLEDVSLKDQIVQFTAADILVVQHGASLANLVWCKQSALVIEVINLQLRRKNFKALARRLSLNYISLPQVHNHAEIDINSLASIVLQKCSGHSNAL